MKKRILLIAAAALLASCNNTEAPKSNGSSAPEVSYKENFGSVEEAITYLHDQKNYTLAVRLSKEGFLMSEFDVAYTEDGYYFGVKDGEYGYKKVNDGVFAYDIYGEDIYFSELLENEGEKFTNIWGSGLTVSFADWSLSGLEKMEPNGGVVSAKDSRVAMMQMTGFDSSYYQYLETARAFLEQDGSFYFTYDLSIEDEIYTVKASVLMVGGSTTEKVDAALAEGKTYYVADENQKKARELFRGDNYTHIYFDENGEEAAWEKFHPDYYSITVDSNYNSSHPDSPLIPNALVKIDNKYVPGAKMVLRGIYHCVINGSKVSMSIGPGGSAYNNVPDIVKCVNYPKLLNLWNAFEYSTLEKTPIEGFDATYSFKRPDLAMDAADNFGLTNVLTNAGTNAASISMSVKSINEPSAKVSFRIIAENGQYEDFFFTDFGKTNEEALDALIATFQEPGFSFFIPTRVFSRSFFNIDAKKVTCRSKWGIIDGLT